MYTCLGPASLSGKSPASLSGKSTSLVAQMVKRLPLMRETGFNPWVGKISWRRKWQPTPVFLPGKSCGQRSLVGNSPWGRKESDTTERLHFHFLSLRQGHHGLPPSLPSSKTVCLSACPSIHNIAVERIGSVRPGRLSSLGPPASHALT